MAIKELYNSIGSGVRKLTGSLSDYFSPQSVAPRSIPPTKYTLKDRGIEISEDDINAMRPIIYGEISNRTPDKQELETNVILNTALNRVREYNARGQKKTLREVVSMPNQYQAYGGAQYNAYSNPPDVVAAAKKKQVDMMVDKLREQMRSGNYIDNTQGAYYYIHNPNGTITYDNKRQLFAD